MNRLNYVLWPRLTLYGAVMLQILFGAGLAQAAAGNAVNGAVNKNLSFEISRDNLQSKIEALNGKQGLDEEQKNRILKLYQQADDNLGYVEWFQFLARNYQESIQQAPIQTKKRRKEIEQLQVKLSARQPENLQWIPSEKLEQQLVLEKGNLSNLNASINKLENDIADQNNRHRQIREETVKAKQDIEFARQELEKLDVASQSKLESEARQYYLNTLVQARTEELKMLEMETNSNPLRVELLKAELHLAELQRNNLLQKIKRLDDELFQRRQVETEEKLKSLALAEQAASDKHALIQEVTRQNFEYNKLLHEISVKNDYYENQKEKIDAITGDIERDYQSAEKKIGLAGLSPALGKILREQRRSLPAKNQFAKDMAIIQQETAVTGLAQYTVEDRLKQLADIDEELHRTFDARIDSTLPDEQKSAIRNELQVLLTDQKALLGNLNAAYAMYLRRLGDYDFARQQMLQQSVKYAEYLDERLFWVPSSAPLSLDYWQDVYHSLQWLLAAKNWRNTVKTLTGNIASNIFVAVVATAGLVVLLLFRNRAIRELNVISDKVTKLYSDRFSYTLQGFVYNLLLVAPLPFLLYSMGWLLRADQHQDGFGMAVGEGLSSASIPLFFIQYFYRLLAPRSIFRQHFLWSEQAVKLLRRQLAWIRFIAVPGVFMIAMTGSFSIAIHSDNLGRLALICILLAMAYVFARVLQPHGELLRNTLQNSPKSWLTRLRYVWYPAVIAVPLVIIGFAVAGYYLSALELQQKLVITLRLIFVVIIIHELVIRWLTLINRQLALQNARKKRKAAEISAKQSADGADEGLTAIDEQLLDIPKINAQTVRLLNVLTGIVLIIGFFVIWKNILPAFSFLNDVVLWRQILNVDGQQIYQSTTLANLFLAGLYLFIAVIVVSNLPGVMEVFIYRQLSLEAGSRYAINQLLQYLLITIAFIGIANELGGSWSQVQWLVAALGVGLGFGLQEIFANLVSGIILLFERPVRVGDTVTIGDISGKVCRIQMRATRIIDWDQKELVIPNKTFITGQLVNWSLTDTVTRLVIPVGIAYGSDVELAHRVITETVRATPHVLAEPEPNVYFLGFGESSLDFSIRVFVSELGHRLPVTHDLHVRINKALQEHGIEIPFPQRDIHVRSMGRPPLQVGVGHLGTEAGTNEDEGETQ